MQGVMYFSFFAESLKTGVCIDNVQDTDFI